MKLTLISMLAMKQSAYSTLLTPKKLCINCKHFIADKNECAIFGDTDLVSGKIDYKYAKSCRNDDKKCGETAIYYEENNYKFITVPYYFWKEWWPITSVVILVSALYSVPLFYLSKTL
jgi:Pyruvate/2-oxoacid:ferredoxin oxidoreductase delta subunit